MGLLNPKKWLVVIASIGLIAGIQSAALADSSNWLQSLFGTSDTGNDQNRPDQKQIEADQASASQIQQSYQANRQGLTQAEQKLRQDQRSVADTSADRQNIQNFRQALRLDVAHQQANAQDLAKDGVADPYGALSYPTRPDRRWENRGSYPGYAQPDRAWDNGFRHAPVYHYEHRRHEANWH
jgi:TolA-binding protein